MGDKKLLTSSEVATLLRVHPKHVYRLLGRGLPAKRVGGKWLFDEDAVMRWAGQSGQGQTPFIEPPTEKIAPPLLAANGDLAVELLLRLTAETAAGAPCVGFVEADRETGLAMLRERSVLATGVHGPELDQSGEPKPPTVERTVWLHLVDREVGLVRGKGKFSSLPSLSKLRWASRPRSAGVRSYLDAALTNAGIDPDRLHARALLMRSHRDVACAVARGTADIGIASRAWAAQLGLAFQPLVEEPYGLLVRATDLSRREIVRLCETAQTKTYRKELAQIAGYQTRRVGALRFDAVV